MAQRRNGKNDPRLNERRHASYRRNGTLPEAGCTTCMRSAEVHRIDNVTDHPFKGATIADLLTWRNEMGIPGDAAWAYTDAPYTLHDFLADTGTNVVLGELPYDEDVFEMFEELKR